MKGLSSIGFWIFSNVLGMLSPWGFPFLNPVVIDIDLEARTLRRTPGRITREAVPEINEVESRDLRRVYHGSVRKSRPSHNESDKGYG